MKYTLNSFAEFLPPAPPVGSNHQHAAAPPIAEEIPEGQRRTVVLSMAGTMRRRGANPEEIFAALSAMNARRCKPPLDSHEVYAIAADVSTRYTPAPSNGGPASPEPSDTESITIPGRIAVTEMSNAERLQAKHGEDIRFSSDRGIWVVWDGKLWFTNDLGAVTRMMHSVTRDVYLEAAATEDKSMRDSLGKWALQSDSLRVIDHSITLAKHLPGIEVKRFAEVFDTHPELLNVRNCTIDLRTGEIREHRREDYITKLIDVEYDAKATCPQFQAFLNDTFPEEGMVGYIVRCMGYFLSGFVDEQAWWIKCGETATSKSTLISIIHRLLGPYAFALPQNYFLLDKGGTDYITANLAGVRFASCVESPEGKKLDVAKIKQLTGGDRVSASLKYQNTFTFNMEAKLVLATNYAPIVPAGDAALWRRLRVVPFHRKPLEPAERVRDLAEKLFREEAEGILRLAVLGSVARFQGGLDEPPAVVHAIAEYRADNDVIQGFLDECTTLQAGDRVPRREFYRCYVKWSEENGNRPMSAKRLSVELHRIGIQGDAGNRYWIGIGLNDRFTTAGEP
jgi:putative DNA primase/helicase